MAIPMTLSTILVGANALLALALLYVYGKSHMQAQSSFTLGLMVFAFLFFAQNLVAFYYLVTMMPYFVPEVQPYVLGLHALQFFGLITINWVSWK